jgi:hypothetical protein
MGFLDGLGDLVSDTLSTVAAEIITLPVTIAEVTTDTMEKISDKIDNA